MQSRLNHRVAVYPGTFDPITLGHVSLARRGALTFDTIIFAVAASTPKQTMFSVEERVSLASQAFRNFDNIVVEPFEGLLVDYVIQRKAGTILRGMRAVADFEYEFQMALMNRKLAREVQTIFMMTDYMWMYLSSTIVKEVAMHKGNVKGLVPECVLEPLAKRCAEQKNN